MTPVRARARARTYMFSYLYSPNRFICRGSHGVVLGALIGFSLRPRLPRSIYYGNYHTKWIGPSKTPRKVNILKELLHSVRERHHFDELTWLRSPCPPQSPGFPPGCFQKIAIWDLALGSYLYVYIYIYIYIYTHINKKSRIYMQFVASLTCIHNFWTIPAHLKANCQKQNS